MVSIFITSIFSYDVSILALSETLLATSIELTDIWHSQAKYVTILGWIIGELIVLISGICIYRSWEINEYTLLIAIIGNLLSLYLGFNWIKISTLHYANYSKSLQLFSSIFSFVYLVMIFSLPTWIKPMNLTPWTILIILALCLLFYLVSSFIMKKYRNNENFIINTTTQLQKIITEVESE